MKLEELEILIEKCLDSTGQPHDYRELESILKTDPEVRQNYVKICEFRETVVDNIDHQTEDVESVSVGSSWVEPRNLLGILLAVAASIALAVSIWLPKDSPEQLVIQGDADSHQVVQQETASESAVAKIVRKINCVWSDDAWALNSSSDVVAGQTIGLERGFMSLEFHNGVNVVLEGPVEFTVVNELRGELEFGGLGVRVPEGFSGYIVDTPSAKVTDLGTAFSLRVSDDGVTDLSVIEGEVEVSLRHHDGSPPANKALILAKDDQWNSVLGIKIPEGSPSPTDFPTANLLEDPIFGETPALSVTEDLLVWFTSETAVRTDRHGRVLSWGDISSQLSLNRHSAWQVEAQRRPRLVHNEINGLPVVRFDGNDDCLITEPFATGDSQTVAILGRLDSVERKPNAVRGPQFINYNGPPNLVVEYDVFTKSVRGRVFAGYGREPRVSGQARVESIQSGETLAIVYTYDHESNRAVLYLNGEASEESEALIPSASARPKVIGIHSRLLDSCLPGDLAEVMIYDRAIRTEEVDALMDYFQRRYGVMGDYSSALQRSSL